MFLFWSTTFSVNGSTIRLQSSVSTVRKRKNAVDFWLALIVTHYVLITTNDAWERSACIAPMMQCAGVHSCAHASCPTFTDIVGIVLVHATRVVAPVETTAGVNNVDQYITSRGFVKRIPLFKVASTNKLVNNVGKQYRVWFLVWVTMTCKVQRLVVLSLCVNYF